MIRALPPRSGYSRAERVSDGVVHLVGIVAAIVAVPPLILHAAASHDRLPAVVAISIYGATLVAMFLCSALYNMTRPGAWTEVLRRLDHSAIYFKIAGTYTPFAVLSGGYGGLLASLWLAALAGTGMRVFAEHRVRWLAIGLYLAMGWLGALAGRSLFAQMPGHVLALIIVGGVLYTAGFAFYLSSRLPFHNTIWHVFVLVASACFFAAITAYVADLHAAKVAMLVA